MFQKKTLGLPVYKVHKSTPAICRSGAEFSRIPNPTVEEVTSSKLSQMIDDILKKGLAVGNKDSAAKEEHFESPPKTIAPGVNP